MKKPVLLIQFRTDVSTKHEEECVARELINKKYVVINAITERAGALSKLKLEDYDAIVLGGSGEYNISDWPKDIETKIKRIKPLLSNAINLDFPVLGICFGHQLIAHWFGGKVKNDKAQAESGTRKIALNKLGMNQNIFKDVPQNFYAVLGHKDTVTKLPTGALLLAFSDKCKIEAYKIKNNIYCVQFHPELDRDGMLWRLSLYPSYADVEKLSEIKKQTKETPYGIKILNNFKNQID